MDCLLLVIIFHTLHILHTTGQYISHLAYITYYWSVYFTPCIYYILLVSIFHTLHILHTTGQCISHLEWIKHYWSVYFKRCMDYTLYKTGHTWLVGKNSPRTWSSSQLPSSLVRHGYLYWRGGADIATHLAHAQEKPKLIGFCWC